MSEYLYYLHAMHILIHFSFDGAGTSSGEATSVCFFTLFVYLISVNNDTSIYLDWLQPFCATFEFFKFCSAIRKNAFRQISTIKLSRKEAKFLTLEEQRMKLSSMMFRVDSLLRPIVDPSTFSDYQKL